MKQLTLYMVVGLISVVSFLIGFVVCKLVG